MFDLNKQHSANNTQKIKKPNIKKFDLEDRFIYYTIRVNSYNL